MVSNVFGNQDGDRGTITIIYRFFYSPRLNCVHIEPAQPTPSTAPQRMRPIPLRDLPLH